MWRTLHSVLALATLVFVGLISLTGTFLATAPIADALAPAVQQPGNLSVAEVLGALGTHFDEPDRLERLPSGAVTLTALGPNGPELHLVDIRTGASLGLYREDSTVAFIRELHRSFLLGTGGRLAAGGVALVITLLSVSGLTLLVRRQGGWRFLFSPVRGRPLEKLHAVSGRLAVLPLAFMALTGFYLTLTTFAVIPNGQETPPAIPESLAELDPVAPAELHGLKDIPFGTIKSVVYPIPGDWFDVFSVTTGSGHIFIDQFTGDVLSEEPLRPAQVGVEWVKALHTGDGLAPLALVLGLSSLSVPVFMLSGLAIWIGRRRRGGEGVRNSVPAHLADSVILVGSENGSTWGFARHLHARLTDAGRKVHLAPLGRFGAYPKAETLLVLTATYGDGHAPKSAQGFARALARQTTLPNWRFAVLGFGDSSFPNYVRFAAEVDGLIAPVAKRLLPMGAINRESSQTFTQWGNELGAALGLPLALDHVPPQPVAQTVLLASRLDYGAGTGTPTAILRFAPARGQHVPAHQPGDMVGIRPPGDPVARYYSVASSSPDGHVEICVRRLPGGVCSGLLHELPVGQGVAMFVRRNPDFHPPRRPLILIAAGTGIAPFAGVIRANRSSRDIALYWGGRDPASDYLYREDIETWLADRRLARFRPAFSRAGERLYVQHLIARDAAEITARLQKGAAIMVCGSPEMAAGVRAAIEALGIDVPRLIRDRRYLQDIY